MIVVVAAELMTVALVLLKTVEAVHLRQQGLHLWLGLVARFEPEMGLWMLLLRVRYSLVLKLKRTLDGERCSAVPADGPCPHRHRERERGSRRG